MLYICPSCTLFGDSIELDEDRTYYGFTHLCPKCGLRTSMDEESFVQVYTNKLGSQKDAD